MSLAFIKAALTEDGEIIELQQRARQETYGKRFMIMFDDDIDDLANRITSGATLRVYLKLPKRLDFKSWRRIEQKELAEELCMSRPSISEALNELHRLGVLARKGNGPVVMWKLTSKTGWRGSVQGYHKANREAAQTAANSEGPDADMSQKQKIAPTKLRTSTRRLPLMAIIPPAPINEDASPP